MSRPKQLNRKQQQLVERHMGYATTIARRYAKKAWWFDDLQSEAWLALSCCALHYDEANMNGATFVTFCTPYINGTLAQYVMKYYGSGYLNKFERHYAKMVSMSKPVGDDEDSLTIEETIPSTSFDEWQRQNDTCEIIGHIVAELTAEERELFDARFGNAGSAEAVEILARKRGVAVTYIYLQARQLFARMCDIAETKQLNNQ